MCQRTDFALFFQPLEKLDNNGCQEKFSGQSRWQRTCSNMSVRVVETTVVILECEDLNERDENEELARGNE